MVIFHLQTTKDTEFLYETPNATPVGAAIEDIAAIHNTILRIRCLIGHLRDIIAHGPMGSDGKRTAPPESAELLQRAAADAEAAVAPEQAKKKFAFTKEYIEDELARIASAVSIAFPDGLPESEPAQRTLAGAPVEGELNTATCELWWARKSLARERLISDYVGGNSRTKAVARLSAAGAGEPPRPEAASRAAQVRLQAERERKDAEFRQRVDDDSGDAEWANPSGLKNTINGLGEVSWRPQ